MTKKSINTAKILELLETHSKIKSKSALAKSLGYAGSSANLARVGKRIVHSPKPEEIEKMSQIFHVPINYFFEGGINQEFRDGNIGAGVGTNVNISSSDPKKNEQFEHIMKLDVSDEKKAELLSKLLEQ